MIFYFFSKRSADVQAARESTWRDMEPTMEGEKEVLEDEDYDEEGRMRIVEQNTKSLL